MHATMYFFVALGSGVSSALALALYFVFHNFCRVHKTLGVTPAMAAGLIETVMKMSDVVGLIDAIAAKEPAVRGSCRKREAADISN
jgi:hypothetical protein